MTQLYHLLGNPSAKTIVVLVVCALIIAGVFVSVAYPRVQGRRRRRKYDRDG